MTIIGLCRRAARLALLAATAALLAGCMLTSETPLFFPEEADYEVLPEGFVFHPYNQAEGSYTPSEASEGPGAFTLVNSGYRAPDGSLTAYFLPSPDEGDYYMLALGAADGFMYGVARLDGRGILEIRVVFDAGLGDAADRLPSGVQVADGGLEVNNRADLNAVVALIADGTLPTNPLIAYAGTGTPPARIIPEGAWYRADD